MKCLEIADKNGFDGWGNTGHLIENNKIVFYFDIESPNLIAKYTLEYSLADLATNKSFLVAVVNAAMTQHDNMPCHSDSCFYAEKTCITCLQKILIDYLTNTKKALSKKFDQLCCNFINNGVYLK